MGRTNQYAIILTARRRNGNVSIFTYGLVQGTNVRFPLKDVRLSQRMRVANDRHTIHAWRLVLTRIYGAF